MKVISVNIARPTTVIYQGKKVITGIFKHPAERIFLSVEGVLHDTVADPVHHGGREKACYAYSFLHYPFWQKKYPDLPWNYGMFGENITIDEMREDEIKIGDIFRIGKAVVQVSQPRQPCYKLGIRFNSPDMVKDFASHPFPGAYFRVLEEGEVKDGDKIFLIQRNSHAPSLTEVFSILYAGKPDKEKILKILQEETLASNVKEYLKKKWPF